jgi:DNA invertase Pin-like site-specific DNA recombinase
VKKAEGQRVVGYARVSDPSQTEGHSLDAQRAEIERWCVRNGHTLVRFYSEEGISARSERIERRPQLVRLLQDAAAGEFDLVAVHMIDRWARNVGVQRQALQKLGEARVGFASVSENVDFTTSHGKLVLTMMGGVAEFFSDQLAAHVSKAQRHRAGLGLPVGPVPFGYVVVEPGGVPQADGREADAIRRAAQRRLSGASYGQIAAELDAEGCRTRNNRRFTGHAVKDLLGCRFYLGVITWHGEEFVGQHEAVLTADVYDRLEAMKRRRPHGRRVNGARGVMQGRIGCIGCGHPLHSDRQHRTGLAMYRERHAFDCPTNNRACMAGPVDEQIGALFGSLIIPDDWPERIATLAAKRGCKRVDVASLQARRKRIYQIHEDGGYGSESEYRAKLADVDAQIRSAQPAPMVKVQECLALFKDLSALWAEATPEERSRLIAPLVARAYVDVETRRVAAITPAEGFSSLLEGVLEQPGWSECFLLPAEAANQPDWWTWWRRGRIELPVQVNGALSLLQAYPDSLISPRPSAAGPCGRGQPMVLGTRYRYGARSAPDKSSLIPIPPGVVRDERHCLGSEGEL